MRRTAEDRKNELIDNLTAARQSVLAAAGSVPPEQSDATCVGFWSVKDLIAHLIGWDETNRQAVEEVLTGERPSFLQYYDTDWRTYNAGLVARFRKESLPELMEDAAHTNQALVEYLHSLTASQILEGKSPREKGRVITIRSMLRAEASDEFQHAEQVRAILERAEAQVDV